MKSTNPGVSGPFQAKGSYDARLANRRAPGVRFVLGFRKYRFWHQNDQVYLFLAKTQIKTENMEIPKSAQKKIYGNSGEKPFDKNGP